MERKYLEAQAGCHARLAVLERRFGIVGTVKLLHLAVLFVSLWWIYRSGPRPAPVILAVMLLVSGVGLWGYHVKLGDRIRHERELLAVVESYLRRLDGGWTKFADDGQGFASRRHPYTHDLDVFGPKSIFQLLNVTRSFHGRHRLAADLSETRYSPKEIVRRQCAVAELAGMDELSHEFQVRGNAIRESENVPSLLKALSSVDRFVGNEWFRLLLLYAPRLFGPVILLILFFVRPLYVTAGALLVLQMLIWAVLAMRTVRFLGPIGKMKYGLGAYVGLFELLAEQPFQCEKLLEIQRALTSSTDSAAIAVKELDRILQRVELRRNALLYFALNALFLWDIGCALSLDQWKSRYADRFGEWFDQLGEFESLLSFSVMEQCVANLVYPDCLKTENTLEAVEIGHPLLPNEKRVYNDFRMDGNITIVSGSNMSGKTTFLRTVGLNLLLAQAGAPVCAQCMRFSCMRIVTSMRISDDLSEGISTFYAELQNIKTILDIASRDRSTIFLVDEIFRGTNSADRLAGATRVIEKLSGLQVPGFISTHDLALCACANGTTIQNWHFSEQYVNNRIVFDYTIRRGIARSTNAEFLMRMIGILD